MKILAANSKRSQRHLLIEFSLIQFTAEWMVLSSWTQKMIDRTQLELSNGVKLIEILIKFVLEITETRTELTSVPAAVRRHGPPVRIRVRRVVGVKAKRMRPNWRNRKMKSKNSNSRRLRPTWVSPPRASPNNRSPKKSSPESLITNSEGFPSSPK